MTQPDISKAKDPDLRGAMAALLRAGALARKTAEDTDTELVFVKDGKIVFVESRKFERNKQIESTTAQ